MKSIEVSKEGNKTTITVYPRFLKGEDPKVVIPNVLILTDKSITVKMDYDIDYSFKEENEELGINLEQQENFSLKGTWYIKKDAVSGFSMTVDKFKIEDELEKEYLVTISSNPDILKIRCKSEVVQGLLYNELVNWLENE